MTEKEQTLLSWLAVIVMDSIFAAVIVWAAYQWGYMVCTDGTHKDFDAWKIEHEKCMKDFDVGAEACSERIDQMVADFETACLGRPMNGYELAFYKQQKTCKGIYIHVGKKGINGFSFPVPGTVDPDGCGIVVKDMNWVEYSIWKVDSP